MARSAQVTLRELLSAIGDDGLLVAKNDAANERMEREKERVEESERTKRLVVRLERATCDCDGWWLWCECEWKLRMLQAPPLLPL